MSDYILGLDLGPTSVGWAAILIDKDGNPTGFAQIKNGQESMPAIGVRIFEAGVENLGQGSQEKPKNLDRRVSRSTRRLLRRKRGRYLRVKKLLQENNIIPTQKESMDLLNQKDPYELRDKAITKQIGLDELGRIILHITRRRGFKSNRKTPDKDASMGEIKKGINRLKEDSKEKTLGQFWYAQIQDKPLDPIRNRQGGYHWVAHRDQYIEELRTIYEKQKNYYPTQLTETLYQKLNQTIFFQQTYELSKRKKRKVIGMCSLIKGQRRCSLADRRAQEFRLLQKINDLKIIINGKEYPLKKDQHQILYAYLMEHKEAKFDKIRDLLNLPDDVRFNLHYKTNDKILGNVIDSYFCGKKIFGCKQWKTLEENEKEDIWQYYIKEYLSDHSDLSADELKSYYEKKYGLTVKEAKAFDSFMLPMGNVSYSAKVLDIILPDMRKGMGLYDAIQGKFKKKWRCLKELPLPIKANDFHSTNPIVVSTLHQVRKVVNGLIRELGKPREIVLEMTRDLKANAERRAEIQKDQKHNQDERKSCEKQIRIEFGYDETVAISTRDITKYRLWESQKHLCAYSLKRIELSELFTRNIEIDHIIPESMSLDNTMWNKVVCFAKENQDKGQRTPIDWLGEQSERFQTLMVAIKKGSLGNDTRKWERYSIRAKDITDKYTPERLLRDTSFIATLVRDYLKRLYPHHTADQCVRTTKGGVTAELRNVWDINPILADGAIDKKNRDDLRHHAVDAAVIAVTSVGMIQKVTRAWQQIWPRRPYASGNIPFPWPSYVDDLLKVVAGINVSHRVQRKVSGALHKDNIYHLETNGPNAGKYTKRQPLNKITRKNAESICDRSLREFIIKHLEDHGNDTIRAFAEPLLWHCKDGREVMIKSVRCNTDYKSLLKIKENAYVQSDKNHHIEIFRGKVKGKVEYFHKVYSIWEVSQQLLKMRGKRSQGETGRAIITRQKPCPDNLEVSDMEFVMSLAKGESILIDDKKVENQQILARVRDFNSGGDSLSSVELNIVGHTLARVEGKIVKDTANAYRLRNINELAKLHVRKVSVDPLGRIRWAND